MSVALVEFAFERARTPNVTAMTTPTAPQTWIITGASNGLGRAMAETALASGDQVVAAVRNPDAVADLNAMGIAQGRIDSIALDVATKTSTAGYALTVKMGCTNVTQLSSFVPSNELKTVYSNGNYVTALGWNSFPLSTPFLWDGVLARAHE